MKRKLFYVLGAAALVLTLASCGESKDEKQIKNDLGGKSNQEVVDYVASQVVSDAAIEKMQSTRGIKASLKEKVKMKQKMGEIQDMDGEAEATAEFVFEYEKGFSLKGSVTSKTKGNNNGTSVDMTITANAEVYYSIDEDTMYINAQTEMKGTNDQKNEYKGKILKVSEQFSKVETPDSTTTVPDVTLPAEYNQIIQAATSFVAEYKSKLTYEIDDDQVKIGLDLTKDDIRSLLSSSLATQIIGIANIDPTIMVTINGVIALDTTVFSSTAKVGFSKDYLLKSIYGDLKAAVKYQGLDMSVESSLDINLDYGDYASEEVKDKDSYTEVIEIPSNLPSESI